LLRRRPLEPDGHDFHASGSSKAWAAGVQIADLPFAGCPVVAADVEQTELRIVEAAVLS
jgi:hypothetical protein